MYCEKCGKLKKECDCELIKEVLALDILLRLDTEKLSGILIELKKDTFRVIPEEQLKELISNIEFELESRAKGFYEL